MKERKVLYLPYKSSICEEPTKANYEGLEKILNDHPDWGITYFKPDHLDPVTHYMYMLLIMEREVDE